jgi:hypothetical protein
LVRTPTGTGTSNGWVKLTCTLRLRQLSAERISEKLATLIKYVLSMYDTQGYSC